MEIQNRNDLAFEGLQSLSVSGQAVLPQSASKVSFCDTFAKICEAVGINNFPCAQRRQAEELCRIIAEIYWLPPETKVRIAGNDLPAEMVAEVYRSLEHEHILLVIDNFGKVGYEIKHKKTYLRTALYNAVFEYEAYWENQFAQDFSSEWGRDG